MKINKILTMTLAGALLVGCADLDTEPQGSTVTADQKAQVVADNPEMVSASVNGICSMFSIYENTAGRHNDFGYPSLMLTFDSRGTDMVGIDDGYNWYSDGMDLLDRGYTSESTSIVWQTLYNQIYTANAVVALIDKETDDSVGKFYLAQALSIRAFDYWVLAQCYQFTYEGNTDAPCVPLILDTNGDAAASGGCPRSTVGEVYTQIMDDLTLAVNLLEGSSFKRADKRYVDLAVAYGLRARVNLTMQNWSDAAADAQKAIEKTDATPKTLEDASKPSFNSMSEEDWMWGIYVAETDRVVTSGIVNWPSHMGTLCYGYASVGAWRRINPTLYNEIQPTDCRKGWFLDASGKSANLSAEQQAYVTGKKCPAYTQVKFAPYGEELGTSTNANHIPLMRVEEMYLILAEAQAMDNKTGDAVNTLQNFVKTYRDPSYVCTASNATGIQNAVWIQRRIELWGEGLSYFDALRLRKGIDRPNTAWKTMDADMPQYNYLIKDTKAEEREAIEAVKSGNGGVTGKDINAMIFQLPNSEIEANQQLSTGDNNLGVGKLNPVN